MLSSSSTKSTTLSLSAGSPSRPVSSSEYRRAECYDGKVLRIHESRRRAHVTGLAKSSTHNQYEKALRSYSGLLSTDKSPSNINDTGSENWSKDKEQRSTVHVTAAAHIPPKAKVIIFQSPIPLRPSSKKVLPALETFGMPTPPLTPKIERLPTPELEDLDESPFCDCCVDARFVEYCASCGSRLHPF